MADGDPHKFVLMDNDKYSPARVFCECCGLIVSMNSPKSMVKSAKGCPCPPNPKKSEEVA